MSVDAISVSATVAVAITATVTVTVTITSPCHHISVPARLIPSRGGGCSVCIVCSVYLPQQPPQK
jgi:hypothetical protein